MRQPSGPRLRLPRSRALRLGLLAVAVVVAASVTTFSLRASPPATRDGRWRQDIAYLTSELPQVQDGGLLNVPRPAWAAAAARLEANVPRLTDGQVITGMAQIVAMIHDDETGVELPPGPFYPLDPQWFGGRLYLLAVPSARRELIGAQLLAIDGQPVAEILARLRPEIPYNNPGLLIAKETGYLINADILYWLGVTRSPVSAAFTVRSATGSLETITIPSRRAAGYIGARYLLDIAKQQDLARIPLPLYLRDMAQPYWMQILPGQQAIYLKYNDCLNDSGFQQLAAQALAELRTHPGYRLIVDLRDNPGGDTAPFQALISGIAADPAINRTGRILGLINGFTDSSAHLDAYELGQKTRAVLIGQPTEDPIDEYGDEQDFQLPNSHIFVQYTTGLIDTAGIPWATPNITVTPTLRQTLIGLDPVLQAALSYGRTGTAGNA
jgi:hypothetical protein